MTKKKRTGLGSDQRPKAVVKGLVKSGERSAKRQKSSGTGGVLEAVKHMTDEQNAKADRTKNRRQNSEYPPLDSVFDAGTRKAGRKKEKVEPLVDNREVHEVLLEKISDDSVLVGTDEEVLKPPISVEEEDARVVYDKIHSKKQRRKAFASAATHEEIGTFRVSPLSNTQPWVDALEMMKIAKDKGISSNILSTEKVPSSSASSSTLPKQKTSEIRTKENNGMQPVWMADSATIVFYIQQKITHSDLQTDESLRRALKKPETTRDPHVCPREHVNKVLACPCGPFKECAMGARCIAKNQYKLLPGPLMEYVSPEEYENLLEGRDVRPPGTTNFCYICLLYFYDRAHHYAREKGPSVVGVNPEFYHIVAPGEYQKRSMIESLSGASDTKANTPTAECTITGFEACGGMVLPLRKMAVQDYEVVTSKRVAVGVSGESETVFGLQETDSVFVKHATTKVDPDPLDPYARLRHIIIHRPDMWEIMQYYFSTANRIPSIGISRLRNAAHPQIKKDVFTVAVYWGITSPVAHASAFSMRLGKSGFEPFPFNAIFCEDIGETVDKLEAILRGGRIHLSYLRGGENYREVLNHPVDVDTPINVYSDALKNHPFFNTHRFLTAYMLRSQIYDTLLSMYPSNTAFNDESIHKRLSIIRTWNEQQYSYLLHEKIADADIQVLRPIDPLPFYFFASDIDFYKVRTETVLKMSPRDHMLSRYGEHPAFLEFREMRRSLRDKKYDREEVVSMWKAATADNLYFDHPYIPEVLKNSPAYVLADLLYAKYTVLWCLMVRINYAHSLVVEEERRMEERLFTLQRLEEAYLTQPSEESIRESLEKASKEENPRKALRLKTTIENTIVSRESVDNAKREHDRQRELVYQTYCFIYTHLGMAERSIDLSLLEDRDFFQTTTVVSNAENIALEEEIEQYQNRKFSICFDPMGRLAGLLSRTRMTKPKFVGRFISAFSELYVNPLTGTVGVHNVKTATRKMTMVSVRVFFESSVPIVNVRTANPLKSEISKSCKRLNVLLSSFENVKGDYYEVGSSIAQKYPRGNLTEIELRIVDGRVCPVFVFEYEFKRKELGKEIQHSSKRYALDARVSVCIDKEAKEYRKAMAKMDRYEPGENPTLEALVRKMEESDRIRESFVLVIAGKGTLYSEKAAARSGMSVMDMFKHNPERFKSYPDFPHNPLAPDNITVDEYKQKHLDVYFEGFLDRVVDCLNTKCKAQERHHLNKYYIELKMNRSTVERSPANFGPIRQARGKRHMESLERLANSSINQMMTYYDETYPIDRVTVHEGMLPNMTPIVGCINFVDDNSAEPKSNTRKPSAVISMLRKMYPKCCQSRKKNGKHIVACRENVSYLMLVRECFLVTMLGAYRHATIRPPFVKALGIFKLTRSHFDLEKFFEDQKRFPSLFTFCVTEALMLWTKSALAYYHYILSRYPIYVRFESTVYMKADKIREDFGRGNSVSSLDTFIDERELFATQTGPVARQNVKNHVYRKTCFNPIYNLRAYMTEILSKPRYRNRPEMPKLLQKAIRARIWSLEPNGDIDLISILREFNTFHPPGAVVRVEDLNIQPCTEVIICWVLKLMANAAPEDSIRDLLEMMPPKDTEVFDLFINTLARHYSVSILPLPEFMRDQQMTALRNRYGIHNPTVASGSLIITTCCAQKKTYDSRERSKSAHQHYGSRQMSLDMRDGHKVYCCSKKDADIERKNNRNKKERQKTLSRAVIVGKSQTEIDKIVDSKTPDWKSYASYRYQPKCGESPGHVYSMVGNVVQIVDGRGITNAFTICINCGSVCGFSRRMYDVNWLSCMTCESEQVLKMRTPRCVACRHFLKFPKTGKVKWRRFHVFNDSQTPITYTFDTFYICDRCFGTKTSYFKPDVIYTTTDLCGAKYATGQRAVFDLREGAIDIRAMIEYYYENQSIRLVGPSRQPNSEDEDEDKTALDGRKRRKRKDNGFYGNYRSIDMHNENNGSFSGFLNVLENSIFPSSLSDNDLFSIERQRQREVATAND